MGDTIDCGQCPNTTYQMIVAEVLGAKVQDVYMPQIGTDVGIPMGGPGGSLMLCINGNSWRYCALETRWQIFERAAPRLEVTPEELDMKDSVIFVKSNPDKTITLGSVGNITVTTNPSQTSTGWPSGYVANHKEATLFQAHFCEVEVDTETGQVELTNVVNVNDLGTVVMPEIVEHQQYGGTVMAWGRPFCEDLIYDPQTGVRLNCNLYDFKYATFNDCGPIETIMKESHTGYGLWGLAGIGEDTATTMPTCITNAIYNAIGVRMNDLPVDPAKILKALGKI